MDNIRRDLAIQFRFANRTLGLTAQDIIDKYNSEHGTDYTKGYVCGLWRDLRAYEAKHRVIEFPGTEYRLEVPRYDHPPHIYADAPTDVLFVRGDRHLPFANAPFHSAMIEHMKHYKRKGYKVIGVDVGDFVDNSAMSKHPKTKPQLAMKHTKESARAAIRAEMDILDEWWIGRGNHDDWFARYLEGKLIADDFYDWLLGSIDRSKLRIVNDTKMMIHNCGTLWRVTHMYEYSKIPGRKANTISEKHDSNTITFHEHSLNVSRDSWNRHTTIACGMMASRPILDYINDYDNTHNVMKNSYVVLENGRFHVMTPYREWQDWKQFDIDPLPLYEDEKEQELVMTGKLDLMKWIGDVA